MKVKTLLSWRWSQSHCTSAWGPYPGWGCHRRTRSPCPSFALSPWQISCSSLVFQHWFGTSDQSPGHVAPGLINYILSMLCNRYLVVYILLSRIKYLIILFVENIRFLIQNISLSVTCRYLNNLVSNMLSCSRYFIISYPGLSKEILAWGDPLGRGQGGNWRVIDHKICRCLK